MRLKVLLVAYACRPNYGTEYGVGWHFFKELSQLAEIHLITEAGPTVEIVEECARLGIDSRNISFIDIGEVARRKCDMQGSWSFYIDYRAWQLRALAVARDLVKVKHFDLVHHLNMIGFREPGFMYRLGLPFVLGPLGGFGGVPLKFLSQLPAKSAAIELVKRTLNLANMYVPRVRRAIRSAKTVLAAVPEAQVNLKAHFGVDSIVLPETGCAPYGGGAANRKNILWVGKEIHRKMFDIAAKSFLRSRWNGLEQLIVVGDFSLQTQDRWRSESIVFTGKVPQAEVFGQLRAARVLIFPSLHEGNPHVIYEAISCGTPVICHDSYGMGHSISGSLGIKIPVRSHSKSVQDFTVALNNLQQQPNSPESEGEFQQFTVANSWEARAHDLHSVYLKVLAS